MYLEDLDKLLFIVIRSVLPSSKNGENGEFDAR